MIPLGVLGASAGSGSAVPWTPANLTTTLRIWLNDDSTVTDAGAGACSQWNDLSGNAYHFEQATAGSRPLIVAGGLNGRRVVRFDGTDDNLLNLGGARGILSAQSACWVAATYDKVADGAGAVRALFGVSPTTGGGTLLRMDAGTGAAVNTPSIVARRLNGDATASAAGLVARTDPAMVLGRVDYVNRTLRIYVNGELKSETTGAWAAGGTSQTGTAHQPVRVGADTNASPGSYLNADLAELLVGSGGSPVETAEIDKLFGYMAHRWGLTAALPIGHPYKTNPPTL